MNIKKLCGFTLAFCLIGLQTSTVFAETKIINSEYKLLIHGITLAKMTFRTEVDGDNYKVSGQIRSSALADIVGKTRGKTTVVGKIGTNALQPKRYLMSYTSGDEKRAFDVVFDKKGSVKKSTMTPKAKSLPSDWIGLKSKDLLAVIDPISSLTFPSNVSPCSRTVSIYDGETRVDLKLSPKGGRRFKTKGFKGQAIACNVRFIPVGGYRSKHDSVVYLTKSKNMEIWFGKNELLNAYFPVYAKIPTRIGDVRVWATKLGS